MVAAAPMKIRAAFPNCLRSSVEVGPPFIEEGRLWSHFLAPSEAFFLQQNAVTSFLHRVGPEARFSFMFHFSPLDAERLKIT